MSIKNFFKKTTRSRLAAKKTTTDHHILDQQIVFRLAKSRLPGWRQWRYLPKFLSKKEKILILTCLIVLSIGLSVIIYRHYQTNRIITPRNGGYYVEGLIGPPRYINPLYSTINQTDRDLVRLLYSGLFTRDQHGHLIKDLAESYEVSSDQLVYTVKLREDLKWSDGSLLTAEDVVFTYNALIDPAYGSPWRNSLAGLSVSSVDNLTIKFTLTQAYNSFLDLLTIGILPNSLWGQISADSANLADLNLKPVGNGPYQFHSLTKDRSGNIKSYQLIVNPYYHQAKPYIPELVFRFYPGYEELITSLNDGSIDGTAYIPQEVTKNILTLNRYQLKYLSTNQLVSVFINSADQTLKNKKIRQALAMAIDKNQILLDNDNLVSHLANGPVLKNHPLYDKNTVKIGYDLAEAQKLLSDDGWRLQEITIEEVAQAEEKLAQGDSDQENYKAILDVGAGLWWKKDNKFLGLNLTTTNEPDYIHIARQLISWWQELGVKVSLEVVGPENINSQIVRRKNYSLLLYGQNLGPDNDWTTFWHSGQSGNNGLNLSNYQNEQVDKNLEIIRTTTDQEKKQEAAQEFQKQINTDLAAIFLYNPTYLYVQNKKIKGPGTELIIEPADRFNTISQWYIKTKTNWQSRGK